MCLQCPVHIHYGMLKSIAAVALCVIFWAIYLFSSLTRLSELVDGAHTFAKIHAKLSASIPSTRGCNLLAL